MMVMSSEEVEERQCNVLGTVLEAGERISSSNPVLEKSSPPIGSQLLYLLSGVLQNMT